MLKKLSLILVVAAAITLPSAMSSARGFGGGMHMGGFGGGMHMGGMHMGGMHMGGGPHFSGMPRLGGFGAVTPGFRSGVFPHHAGFFPHHAGFFPHHGFFRHHAFFRHHRLFHHGAFFASAAFIGSSCWQWEPTPWGWRHVWVCDDY